MGDHMDIADLFHDPENASMMDPMSVTAMMDALVAACANRDKAQFAAKSICSIQPDPNSSKYMADPFRITLQHIGEISTLKGWAGSFTRNLICGQLQSRY